MKYITLAILALTLTACAPEMETEGLKVDAELQQFANRFTQVGAIQGRQVSLNNITIEFDSNITGSTIGICTTGGGKQPRVRINTNYWKGVKAVNAQGQEVYTQYPASVADREELMFHELAHCVLGRNHDETKIMTADGFWLRKSIMSPYHLGSYTYGQNYNYYMSELFGNSPDTTLLTFTGRNQFDPNFYASMASNLEVEPVREYKMVAHQDGETRLGCGEEEVAQ